MGDLPQRLEAVLPLIYLVFNEGYASTRGEPLARAHLSVEAIRLGRLLRTLMAPRPPAEVTAGSAAARLINVVRRRPPFRS